jgi:hypothetical protein
VDEAKQRGLAIQYERVRAATVAERLEAAASQRRIALELLRGGLRSQFPHLTEEELETKMGEIIFGAGVWRDICERRRRRRDRACEA